MKTDHWKRVNEVFQEALELGAPKRAAFIEDACGGDRSLQKEVVSLIDAHERAGTFIDAPARDLVSGTTAGVEGRVGEILPPGHRLGPYEVVGFLGAGGMGQVYRARDPRLSREVAIKIVAKPSRSSDESRRLEREARAAAALAHPNILAVYDVGVEGERAYVVSELLEGETLRARLVGEPLPQSQCLDYARQIASGLAAAHAKGILHRDLKPENIFVTHAGWVKILDFGLAKQMSVLSRGRQDTPPPGTEPGAVLGTVGYMSPEQARGQIADQRSDIFSFGAVLYEMLTGRRAFAADSAVETLNAILTEEPPGIPGLPSALDAIVWRCLSKMAQERFPSGIELAAALEAVGAATAGDETAARGLMPTSGHSIAVLPFVNMTGDPEQEYFCEGIAEELINVLTRIEGLHVVARASAFRSRARGETLRRVGRELAVDKVLEGSVRKAGARLRINVQLVNVTDGYQLWSERYDRGIQDVFALEDEIATRVLEALRLKLDPRRSPARRYTDDIEAYRLYLRGLHFWNKRHEGGLRQALKAFEQAIDRDPSYALAYAGMADSYAVLGLTLYEGPPPREAMPKARAAAIRALEIDASLAGPYAALGWVRLHYEWNWAAAEADFRRALELDPERATSHHWYGFLLSATGRSEDALGAAQRAWELDPLSLIINSQLCQAHYYARRFEDVIACARKVLEMEPTFAVGHFWLGLGHVAQGSYDDAITAYEAFATHSGGRSRARALIGNAQARAGRLEAASRSLVALRELARLGHVSAFHFALVHLGLGERDEAMAWLERAHDERSDQIAYLAVEPLLDPVRSDPRFEKVLGRLGLPWSSPSAPVGRATSAPHTRSERSIAVLPFRDLSQVPASAHLGLALADATINELAQIKSLLVRPTSAVLRYRDEAADPRRAADKLGVDAIVEGSFQRAGARLRVTVRLLEAREGRSLWARKIETSLDDVFQMQDEVSRSIARALEVELTPFDERRLNAGRRAPGPSAAAYELYVKGKVHLFGESLSAIVAAVDWFERAREMEPEFALAWAGLADAYARMAFSFQPEGDWYARARSMCDRALALEPELPEGRYVQGRLRWSPQGGFDHAGAIADLVPALLARPNLEEGYVLLGNVLHHVGLPDEARGLYERAEVISPGHPRARWHVMMSLLSEGRYEEALEMSRSLPSSPAYSFGDYLLALCQIHLGRLDDARTTVAEIRLREPGEVLAFPLLGLIAARGGDASEADRQIRLTEQNRKAYGHYHHAQYDVACIHSLLGHGAEAFRWLQDAAADGFPCVSQFERDEFLTPLRAEPGVEEWMDALKAERARYRRLYGELRSGGEGVLPGLKRGGTGSVPASALRTMLAVLPFENLGGDPDDEYFADGLTEELIGRLGRLDARRLGVIARTSAMTYKKTGKSVERIARELAVDYLLEGSVRRQGRRVKVDARLVLARDQSQVWSSSYERDLTDVLSLQGELGSAVAAAIGLWLVPRKEVGGRSVGVGDEAYQAYLRGRYCWNKRTAEEFWRALEFFQDAVRCDPVFAPAHVGIADCYAALGDVGVAVLRSREAFARAKTAVERALALDDTLAEAHTSLAHLHMHEFQWVEAEREFRRALELDANYATAHQWYGLFLAAMERHGEAQEQMRRALDLDPVSRAIHTDLGLLYYYARNFDRAIAQYRQTLELDPRFARAYLTLGSAYAQMGRHEEAIAVIQQALALSEDVPKKAALARACALGGRTEDAVTILDELERRAAHDYVAPYPLALIHAALGQTDRAFEYLGNALEDGAGELAYAKVDPWLDSLRPSPRFSALLDAVHLGS